jgi:hypothetical protein
MEIVFATQNLHKLEEISALLGEGFHLMGLKELNIHEDIPEDHLTLQENASQKAWYIYDRTGLSCFADDTGLEVDALDGAPWRILGAVLPHGTSHLPAHGSGCGKYQKAPHGAERGEGTKRQVQDGHCAGPGREGNTSLREWLKDGSPKAPQGRWDLVTTLSFAPRVMK